ncbi:hypothetical protein KR054_003706 [Drosophila jambulina]|nr:hypothetical protein KR054_003706 [Drosophila jambulina]
MFRGKNSNAFTPQGRILQMQYACEASKLGATSFGIRTYDVIILAAEKRPVSPLWVAGALEKIVKLDGHLYCTIAGMTADARSLIDPARVSCANHWFDYNEYMPIESLVDTLSQQTICFGMGTDDGDNSNGRKRDRDSNASSSSDSNAESDDDNGRLLTTSRPYGVALLLGGVDNDMLQLWHLEPNGEFGQCGIKAIGSASGAAEDWLCRHHKIDMNMSQTMDLALSTMQVIINGQRLTPEHLDLMVITKGPRCHLLTKKELEMEIVRRQDSEDWH